MAWDTVIGLEVHAQLKTKSKLFSSAATAFGAPPNSQTSFIDAGLPGVLPVLNQKAVYMAIQFGLAIHAQINKHSYFERKNYFYPDLPKGYQISQFQAPIVSHGYLMVELDNNREKKVSIVRAHLEEDAGKSLHDAFPNYSGVDLNRAGIPLLEIVTAPCLFSAEEVVAYLKKLHQLVRFLGICDGNMQEGSFRCDVNISLKPRGSEQLGVRTELKNLNSFRFIEKAIAYEQARHQDLLENGQAIHQETRLYNPDTNATYPLRSKENENDYRYFPDPDLLPLHISEADLEKIKQTMPPLPEEIKQTFLKNKLLNQEDINFLLASPAHYKFFQAVKAQTIADEKIIINWLKGTHAAALNEANLDFENSPVPPSSIALLLNYLSQKTISAKIAKEIFIHLWAGEKDVDEIIKQEGLSQTIDANLLDEVVKSIINQYPQQVADYRAGKDKLLAFFIGQVMKQTKGQANPDDVNRLLKNYLESKT
ncbi:Asp-tRNA(Asn)/Glu-tRNA(Gln) amidotransferase subunit GatB [Legionella jamestowniensis]|uniref:Aspartyl/glutamyl-tRNA(Asn/Gln) amidotransferase subunit B n=1 Tax=Legionella jamestowniensis TaxID=455 RepID=A0A0W0UJL6_9GAMM|nr:Asp-tRNA(Asn)/Glu-tRNA(Gln) amidotransferase subunit GatB [Legionella jamestowniensis]KTD08094.1 aspartyl/glutamyl-tRNA amidotransferase subunit B [Legionella jamestowniensis]OCH97520.1 aspartyl/glutamyl-tRNA amidotransferase subunit B [Legionella jamestowniensis]SFM09320.1 aspartyl/glutamyl-tRNA(Asn/Gln) amidotransferase subunit B [Legionella jamestowniensis DSM 19215]